MTINDLAKEVHQNAVEHGWWDGNRDISEIIALIHSEWSEALEEARAGRPMIWYACKSSYEPDTPCMKEGCGDYYDGACALNTMKDKPEGIAVELIDGCIRILDFIGSLDVDVRDYDDTESSFEKLYPVLDETEMLESYPTVIAVLHSYTAQAMDETEPITGVNVMKLLSAMALATTYVKAQGLNPLEILMMKHAYNKTRPYKHGKRF